MNHDHSVEEALGRYRPAAPSAALRLRVEALHVRRQHHVVRWFGLVAAAAAIVLYTLASRTYSRVGVDAERPYAAAREAVLADLTSALGGGPSARDSARRLLVEALEAR